MKSKLLLSKILSYCSSPKLESPVTSVALGQSQVSQSLKVTSWCLESESKVKMDDQPIPGLEERFQALCTQSVYVSSKLFLSLPILLKNDSEMWEIGSIEGHISHVGGNGQKSARIIFQHLS